MTGNNLIGLFVIINVAFTAMDVSLHRRRNRHNRAAMSTQLELCHELRRAQAALVSEAPERGEPLAAKFKELDRVESELCAVLNRPRWRQLLDF